MEKASLVDSLVSNEIAMIVCSILNGVTSLFTFGGDWNRGFSIGAGPFPSITNDIGAGGMSFGPFSWLNLGGGG